MSLVKGAEYRVFFGHAKSSVTVEDDVAQLQAQFACELPDVKVVVCSGAEVAEATFHDEGEGNWSTWNQWVATGLHEDGAPAFHCMVLGTKVIGRATAEQFVNFRNAGKKVLFWAGDVGVAPVVDLALLNGGKSWKQYAEVVLERRS